jgi:hypothetical protein
MPKINTLLAALALLLPVTAQAADPTPVVQYYPDPAPPQTIFAPKTATPPTLDGNLSDAAWKSAFTIDRLQTPAAGETTVNTTVRVCYDDKFLYVAFDCQEPHFDKLNSRAGAGEDKWPDNCVEVFIDRKRRKAGYYQFVTNERDAHNDYGPGQDIKWNGAWTSKAAKTPTGWATEIAIPWADFGYPTAPPAGTTWGINVTRERALLASDKTSASVELATWAPISSFGAVAGYGLLHLGTKEDAAALPAPSASVFAALDKATYSTLDRTALLALSLTAGRPTDTTLTANILPKSSETPLRQYTLDALKSGTLALDIPLKDLPPGQYTLAINALVKNQSASAPTQIPFTIAAPAQAPVNKGEIQLLPNQPAPAALALWHARTGVPLPEGALWDEQNISLLADGKPIPVQAEVLARWSKNGSIKWLGLDFQTPLDPKKQPDIRLAFAPDKKPLSTGSLTFTESAGKITINTGTASFVIKKQGFNFLDQMTLGGKDIIAPASSTDLRGAYMADESGKRFWAQADPSTKVTIEQQGPLAGVIRVEGAHADPANPAKTLGRYVMRFYFYSGAPYFRLQHTFIIAEDTTQTRYRDIALFVPIKGDDARFGLPTGPSDPLSTGAFDQKPGTSVSLLQRDFNSFVIRDLTNPAAPADILQSQQAPGWFARGQVAILLREFWQNFPKEFETSPQGLTVHFWPGNGQRVLTPEQEASPANAWRLPFVHQGKLLDFQMPQHYFTGDLLKEYGFAKKVGDTYQLTYGDGARNSNAMGVGKTHDMLFAFGPQASHENLDALRTAFDSNVHFLASPEWFSKSLVSGPVAPYNPARFPVAERYFAEGFEFLQRLTWDLNQAYGMFNYGDSFTLVNEADPTLRPRYYRLWAGFHHGRARVPWLLYLRSGDPKYLNFARANTAHLMDVDVCHFTTPQFATHPNESARKAVGGMGDYKGVVHWHTGARTGEYNSQLDFLLYDYYLLGNRRAWDVAIETAELAVAKGNVAPERQGAGCISIWVDYYKATFSAPALLRIASDLPKMYVKPAYEHDPASITYAPFMEPWIEYSRDPVATAFFLQFADTYAKENPIQNNAGHFAGGAGRPLEYAYRLTNNIKYLQTGWSEVNVGPRLYEFPGDPQTHMVDWLPYSYTVQNGVYLLSSIQSPFPMDQTPYNAQGPRANRLANTRSYALTATFTQTQEGPFTVSNRFSGYGPVTLKWFGPGNKLISESIIPTSQLLLDIKQPADSLTGEYRMELTSTEPFYLYDARKLSSLGTQRFLVPEKGSPHTFGPDGRWYFFVPQDCESFSITLASLGDPTKRSAIQIFTPDDQPSTSLSLPYSGKDQTLTIEPKRADRGKVWSIAASNACIRDTTGIPRFFSPFPNTAKP